MAAGGWKSKDLMVFAFVVQSILYTSVFLNLVVLRQIISFFYLLFVPGFIFLKLMKLNSLDLAETLLYSLGLSITLLIFVGLFANEILPLVGVNDPLSLGPVLAFLNVLIILMALIGWFTNRKFSILDAFGKVKLSPKMVLLIIPPLLSIVGTAFVNSYRDSTILLSMIVVVSILVILTVFSDRLFLSSLYPFLLIAIAVALLFHASLISSYIFGNDLHEEYHVFKFTQDTSQYTLASPYPLAQSQYNKFNGMLSITILPVIYSTVSNIDGTSMFKVVYPLIFAFVPLGLYKLYTVNFGKKEAFLSAFFFMAHFTFFTELVGLARQMVAELFYVLLFLVIFTPQISSFNKKILLIFFGAALVVSHYAISYLFLLSVALTWILLYLMRIKSSRKITLSFIALFFVISFSWYIYTSKAGSFEGFTSMGANMIDNFSADFFNPSSRGEDVLRGLGVGGAFQRVSLLHQAGRALSYVTEGLIVVGFIALLLKFIHRDKTSLNQEYFVLLSINMVLIVASITLPNFARYLRMTRFYHILLFLLAPLFIVGIEYLFKFVSKSKTRAFALILLVLIPFFLFQTEFAYVVTGDYSWSIPLTGTKDPFITYSQGLVDEENVFSAVWLSNNLGAQSSIYADALSSWHELNSYGMIPAYNVTELANVTAPSANGIIYLSRFNVVYGVVSSHTAEGLGYWNLTQASFNFTDMNMVYSNGASEIYRNPNGG